MNWQAINPDKDVATYIKGSLLTCELQLSCNLTCILLRIYLAPWRHP